MSHDKPASAVQAPPATPSSANRLSIAHLLLWMTMTAVALVSENRQWLTNPFGDDHQPNSPYSGLSTKWKRARVLRLIVTPVNGAALAGAALAIWRTISRRNSFLIEPGHWLLVLISAQYLPTLIGWSAIDMSVWKWRDLLMIVAIFAVPASLAMIAAVRSIQRRWRASFALMALGYLVCAVGLAGTFMLKDQGVVPGLSLLTLLPGLLIFSAYLCGIASSIRDFRLGGTHDIFHWIGCFALGAVFIESTTSWCMWQLP